MIARWLCESTSAAMREDKTLFSGTGRNAYGNRKAMR